MLRRRFNDLVSRQLDLFAQDSRDALERIAAARARYRDADRDEAEAAFGDYQDEVDWAAEELIALRDAYASTLDEETAEEYRRAYLRGVRRRFGALADALQYED